MSNSEFVDDFLEHFGVKGMKWGVRKSFDTAFGTKSAGRKPSSYKKKSSTKDVLTVATGLPSPVRSRKIQNDVAAIKKAGKAQVKVTDKRKKIKTSGGEGRPAHSDAVRARTLGQVGKKSGLKALSNEELQVYAHRLQLEQNVKRLNYNDMNPGKKFVASLLGRSGNSLASEGVNKGTKELGKRAVKLAIVR